MKEELQNKLFTEFPNLFSISCLECGDGWYKLIRELCQKMMPLAIKTDEEPMQIIQLKEKYGTLRVYLTCCTDELSDLIEEFERKSAHICEICGEPGILIRSNSWYMVRCLEHV